MFLYLFTYHFIALLSLFIDKSEYKLTEVVSTDRTQLFLITRPIEVAILPDRLYGANKNNLIVPNLC